MSDVRINLDPCNPGQFYACCGLLELLELRGAYTHSHFELDRLLLHKATFVLATELSVDLPDIVTSLKKVKCRAVPRGNVASNGDGPADSDEPKTKDSTAPVAICFSEGTLTLDWWLDGFWSNNSDLKLWAGNQSSLQIWTKLCVLIPATIEPATIFQAAEMAKGRFGVDPRSAWEALDLGY